MNSSRFSMTLRLYRENSGLTQKQVAEALGVDRSTYSYYETGSSMPNLQTLLKLSTILNVEYNVLVDAINVTNYGESDPEDKRFEDRAFEKNERIYSLSRTEQNLLLLFRSLGTEQQNKVENYVRSLHEAKNLKSESKNEIDKDKKD